MKYLLHTQVGIERVAEIELIDRFKKHCSIDYVGYVPSKNGIVQLDWKGEPQDFYNKMGSIEDAFYIVDYVADLGDLLTLKGLYRKIHTDKLKKNIDYFFDKLNPFDKSPEFRLVVRKKSKHNFKRIILQNMMEEFFKKEQKRIHITKEEDHKEIWITLLKNRLIIAIRLTTREKRQRKYKTETIPGSLRPSIAFSMNYLAELKSSDVVWDPFCGVGTIGAELIENFTYSRLILSDLSQENINKTMINLKNTSGYKRFKSKIAVKQCDFFNSNYFANKIITDPPFGKAHEAEDSLVLKIIEKANTIKNLQTMVILHPQIYKGEDWQITRIFPVQVLGFQAYITRYEKR
jgi:tRNA G10  N-methylase Trm11